MPGLRLDLNLDPDLQAACRRLSFRGAYSPSSPRSPPLPMIGESPEEEPAPPPPSPRTIGALYLYPAPGGTPTPAVGAPVSTSLSLALPGQSQSQQAQEAAAATRMSEQRRRHEEERASFAVYQQQRQQALAAEAGLQQALAAELQPQQLMLYTVDGRAASYETKWDELHPVSQRLLLQIEDRIREHRGDSEQLDRCRRFDDLSLCNMRFELDASQITQSWYCHHLNAWNLRQSSGSFLDSSVSLEPTFNESFLDNEAVSISTIMNRDKNSIDSLMTVIKEIMWNTEFAIRSYAKLRPRFVYLSAEGANSGFSNHFGSSGAQTDSHQLLTMAPKFHCYSRATRRPSPFLQQTVARFEDGLGKCCKWILELEQLVQMKDGKTFAESLESLSNVMSNVLDYLIHVASKVEHFHQYVETMETRYLNYQWRRGDLSNSFLKANRREAAEQEAAHRIIHPMLHLTPPGQPTTLVAEPMIASQLQQSSFSTVAASPVSYPTVPLPSVLPPPPSSTQTSPAPSINPLSSSGPTLQSIPFHSFSTLALGSMPATSSFGTGISSTATSLFPVPSGGGTAASGINRVLLMGGSHPQQTARHVPCISSLFGGHACALQTAAYLSNSSWAATA